MLDSEDSESSSLFSRLVCRGPNDQYGAYRNSNRFSDNEIVVYDGNCLLTHVEPTLNAVAVATLASVTFVSRHTLTHRPFTFLRRSAPTSHNPAWYSSAISSRYAHCMYSARVLGSSKN